MDETLELVGLGEKRGARVGSLSGGQQRRLDVGVGIIGNPELLFLDEPTTGFDPSARRGAWNMIEGLKELGTTIVLTTHYMEEAQHLADRVVIMREGGIVAEGAPETLGDQLGRETLIRFRTYDGIADRVSAAVGSKATVMGNEATIASTDPQRDLYRLLQWAEGEGVTLPDLEVRRPSLEDVFLEVTSDFGERPMSDVGLVLVQTRYAVLATLRTPRALLFGALFPLIFLLLFNSLFTNGRSADDDGGGSHDRRPLLLHRGADRLRARPLLLQHPADGAGRPAGARSAEAPAWDAAARMDVRRRPGAALGRVRRDGRRDHDRHRDHLLRRRPAGEDGSRLRHLPRAGNRHPLGAGNRGDRRSPRTRTAHSRSGRSPW